MGSLYSGTGERQVKTGRGRVLAGAAAVAAVALAYIVIDEIIDRNRRIAWHELRSSNHERFLEQLSAALPIGTSKEDVDAYLARENIPYDYRVDASGSTYRLRAYGAGRALWVVQGDIGADIVLDHNQRVSVVTRFAIYKGS